MTVDADLARIVLQHRANVRAAWAQKTNNQSGVPPALFWANSMVLSRCFHLWAGEDKELPETIKGGMIPFIDLINHDNEPNCRLVEDSGAICCVARRDIESGEELTHPYTQDASNRALFSRFGFVVSENPADRVPFPDHIPRFPRAAIQPLLLAGSSAEKWSQRAVESVSEDFKESDASEIEEEHLLVLYFEVKRQLQLLDERGRQLIDVGFCFQEYLEERIALLRETERLLHHVAHGLNISLPEVQPLPPAGAPRGRESHGDGEGASAAGGSSVGGDDGVGNGLVDLSDMLGGGGLEGLGGIGGGDEVMASFLGGSTEAPPDIMAMLAPRTEEEMAAAAAEEEAREKETGEFNLSFESALASFKGNVDIKFDD